MIIRNGTIFDAVHDEPYKADIQIKNGKIAAIKAKIKADKNEKVIDAEGKYVYPGFIDAHSHLGLDGYGIGFEGSDYNEMNDRAEDALCLCVLELCQKILREDALW